MWDPGIAFEHFQSQKGGANITKDQFTHEPRAVIMKVREPKRKKARAKAVPTNLQNHVI